jgi:hypothetical protein
MSTQVISSEGNKKKFTDIIEGILDMRRKSLESLKKKKIEDFNKLTEEREQHFLGEIEKIDTIQLTMEEKIKRVIRSEIRETIDSIIQLLHEVEGFVVDQGKFTPTNLVRFTTNKRYVLKRYVAETFNASMVQSYTRMLGEIKNDCNDEIKTVEECLHDLFVLINKFLKDYTEFIEKCTADTVCKEDLESTGFYTKIEKILDRFVDIGLQDILQRSFRNSFNTIPPLDGEELDLTTDRSDGLTSEYVDVASGITSPSSGPDFDEDDTVAFGGARTRRRRTRRSKRRRTNRRR